MSRISRQEPVRQGRIPVASNREPLLVKGLDKETYVHRWVLNKDDRLEKFLAGGWEFVNKRETSALGERTVESTSGLDNRATKPAGHGMTLYLMRIPREFWEEDQAAKQAEIKALEDSMKRPESADYGKMNISEKKGG